MNIGIDISAALGGPSGLRTYLVNFLGALAKLETPDRFFLCAYFWGGFPERALRAGLPEAANFELHLRRLPQSLLYPLEQGLGVGLQERLMAPLRLDVFHGTGAVLPRLRHLPSVLTIHHVAPVEPGVSLWDRFYFGRVAERSIEQATLITSISESTRRDLIDDYGVAPERVRTIYYGGASPLFHPRRGGEDLSVLGLRAPFYLFVSAVNPRKNLLVLARAFARLRALKAGPRQLVFVGRQDPAYYRLLRAELERLDVLGDAVFLARMETEELRSLYQQAEAMVYPSTMEGFGLPVIEAMACGTTVVAARATCLPEIG
ncbi:MAG: glycosyltransferase family 4 protein, partial [Elusimicrobia bacterium]|nr:glycosyltransferase family 4 protein [Elusimicrobiota bacterium]